VSDNQVTNIYAFIHHKMLVRPWLDFPAHGMLIDKPHIADNILIRKQRNNCINAGLPFAEATFAWHNLASKCNF